MSAVSAALTAQDSTCGFRKSGELRRLPDIHLCLERLCAGSPVPTIQFSAKLPISVSDIDEPLRYFEQGF